MRPNAALRHAQKLLSRRPFSPKSLSPFVWYDPSDHSTLFQDTGGTTPVTATGQSVALMRDKSGNGHDLSQATAAACPTYQVDGSGRPFLLFDGVNDMLTTPGFALAQPFCHASALRQVGWVANTYLFDGLTLNTAAVSGQTASPQLAMYAGGAGWAANNGGAAVGANAVLTAQFNGASSSLTVNNGAATTGNPGAPASTGGLTIGGAGGATGFFANFALYGTIILSGTPTAGQIAQIKTWLGLQAGLVL